jgi:hypothetical protein
LSPLIILSAAGFWAFVESFKNKTIRLVCVVTYTVAILTTIADMRALHPYEYTYFNRLVAGGMEQANQRFEMEYWGTSFREAADWLNEYYRPVGVTEIVYTSNSLPQMVDYYMRQAPAGGGAFAGPFQAKKPKSTYSFAAKANKPKLVLATLCTRLSAKGYLFST